MNSVCIYHIETLPICLLRLSRALNHRRQVLELKKNLGGQLLSHFLIIVLVPKIQLKHT